MSSHVAVYGHTNNGPRGKRPREPLVQVIASGDGFSDVQSICFHPNDAYAIALAIVNAAKAAEGGLRRKPVILELASRS